MTTASSTKPAPSAARRVPVLVILILAVAVGGWYLFTQRSATANATLVASGTIEATGTMLAGQGVEALYASVSHLEDSLGLISIGLNCATGPEFMTDPSLGNS